ncbi:MAG TPA: hypothetical protein QF509_05420 [Rhodospirillales bacterium]|nr:hypothetical protein [Rhodospirillaceae bacterium]HJN23333.1 hypothetical protein [Rhodospirillales bacterium]
MGATKGFEGMPGRSTDSAIEMDGRDRPLGAYSVFHVKRNAQEEIFVDVVSAADEATARRRAERLFGNIAILHVRKNDLAPEDGPASSTPPAAKTQHPHDAAGYPSARFINGKFHATSAAAAGAALQDIDE